MRTKCVCLQFTNKHYVDDAVLRWLSWTRFTVLFNLDLAEFFRSDDSASPTTHMLYWSFFIAVLPAMVFGAYTLVRRRLFDEYHESRPLWINQLAFEKTAIISGTDRYCWQDHCLSLRVRARTCFDDVTACSACSNGPHYAVLYGLIISAHSPAAVRTYCTGLVQTR